jgi:hypothetical protein
MASPSPLLLFLLWFVLILGLKWPVLNQPPVWDGSMGLFPAAITLAETDFDLGFLLRQPGYESGGPNVHPLSLVTWLTAGVMAVVGDGPLFFPTLHLIHFVLAAVAMVAVHRFALLLLSPLPAALTAASVLLFPLVRTQTGFMYLEVPLLTATVLSVLAWTAGKPYRAALWAVVAVLVKPTGVIAAGALLLASLFDRSRPGSRLLRDSVFFTGLAAILGIFVLVTGRPVEAGSIGEHFRLMAGYLVSVPDLLLLFLVFVAFSLAVALRKTHKSPSGHRAAISMLAMMISFLGFFSVLPLFGGFPVIPRYYVQVAPFMLVTLFAALESRVGPAKTTVWLIGLLMYFLVNGNGRFYPNQSLNNFALQERSGGYAALLELHLRGIQELEDVGAAHPVFYAQPVHYRLHYPQMGYANGPLVNGFCIFHEYPYREGRLSDFPPEFFMLFEYHWLGGEIIQDVRGQAEAEDDWDVESFEIVSGGFQSELIHIRRRVDGDEAPGLE